MQEGIDLDMLIKKDREQAKKEKTHKIHKNQRPPKQHKENGDSKDQNYKRHNQRQRQRQGYSETNSQEKRQDKRQRRDHRQSNISDDKHQKGESHGRENNRQKYYSKQRTQSNINNREQFKGYAIFIKGFVCDISSEQILALVKGKKITEISTSYKGVEGKPIEQKNKLMQVTITFVNQQQADQFIKQFAGKKLDSQYQLTFQYRRAQ